MSWGRSEGRRRRFGRPVGCLVWVIALVALLLVLSVLFGGFQKGTRVNGAPRWQLRQAAVTATASTPTALNHGLRDHGASHSGNDMNVL